MTCNHFINNVIPASRAVSTIISLDWPCSLDMDPGCLKQELIWIPFDHENSNFMGDYNPHPWIKKIEPGDIDPGTIIDGTPESGTILPSVNEDSFLLLPFWYITSGNGDDWAAVNAVSGKISGGELPVSPVASKLRLAFIFCMFMVTIFLGGAIFLSIIAVICPLFKGLAPSIGAWPAAIIGILLCLAAITRIIWKINNDLLPALAEPVLRIDTGKVQLPFDCTWLVILHASAMMVLFTVPLLIISFLLNSHTEIKESYFSDFLPYLIICQALLAILFGIYSEFLSRGSWLSSEIKTFKTDDFIHHEGLLRNAVSICSGIIIFSFAGGLIAATLNLSGIWELVPGISGSYGMIDMIIFGTESGAFVALFFYTVSGESRIALIAGMLALSIGEHFFGTWITLFLSLAAVTFSIFFMSIKSNSDSSPDLHSSIKLAVGFNLGAASGCIIGRTICFFLLGAGGAAVGEIIGERILAAAGFYFTRHTILKKL